MWSRIFKSKASAQTAIITRTKDRPLFLARASKSIMRQTTRDWCWLILHGGGDRARLDEVLEPVRNLFPGQVLVKECPTSLPDLNIGLSSSESEFVAIHDDDDTWEPEFLESSVRCLREHPEKGASVTKAWMVQECIIENEIEFLKKEIFHEWQSGQISLFRLAESLTFPPISLLIRKSVFSEVGGFRPEMQLLWDWDFCLRLFSRFPVAYLPELLASYHIHGENMSEHGRRSNAYQIEGIEARNRYLREDLASGKHGLGYLVAMSHAHGHLFQKLNEEMAKRH